MALFARKQTGAFGAEPVRAAAGTAAQTTAINQTIGYTTDFGRQQAIQNATISRARDLIVSMVSGLPINQYSLQWMGEEYEEVAIPGETWMSRPDPYVTRQFILAWTTDDLYFHGKAVWHVTSRSKTTGFPLSFQWIPMADIQALDMSTDIKRGLSDLVSMKDARGKYLGLSPGSPPRCFKARRLRIGTRLLRIPSCFVPWPAQLDAHRMPLKPYLLCVAER